VASRGSNARPLAQGHRRHHLDSPLLHIYGSSETSGVGWRDWPEAGYQLHPFWSRIPGQEQALVRHFPSGQTTTVDVQDQMNWLAPDRFQPGPRLDGAVQVGGVNVFPLRFLFRLPVSG
jgi:long-chain acyl-CoA synthetase